MGSSKVDEAPSDENARTDEEEKPPFLERVAVAYFRSRSASLPEIRTSDAVHHLSDDERKALTRIQRMTVVRAFMIGGLSAAMAGTFETFAMPAMGIYDGDDLGQKAVYWAWLGSVAGIAAVFEIGFLYFDALRSVHELARTAGVQMFKHPKQERAAVTAALARAALEIPNSKKAVLGVDPQREIVKWKLVIVTLAYKAKIGVSNFIMKAIVRRALGRAAVRSWLSYVAVPVTGGWNALIAWKVMREARIRVMGPSAAEEICDILLAGADKLSAGAKHNVVAAVGASIVKTRDMHPNLECLLREAQRRVEVDGEADVGDPDGFLHRLAELDDAERLLSVRMLQIACVIDGKLARSERTLIGEAQAAAGLPVSFEGVDALRSAFVAGERLTWERLSRVG